MRREPFVIGACYHLYGRGVDHQAIFFLPENWAFFLARLRERATPSAMAVVAYCLMPNHYHLAIRALCAEVGGVAIQPLLMSYTKAVNQQQGRSGPLLAGPYRARAVGGEDHLVQLTAYLHLNPVHAGLVSRPEDWAFSSYRDYIGLRGGTLAQPGEVLARAGSREAYRQYVETYRWDDRLGAGLD